jgi:hypothetical protein
MSVSYQNQPYQFCPRCRAALPPQTGICYNCGYAIAPVVPPYMPGAVRAGSNQQPWMTPPAQAQRGWAGDPTAGNRQAGISNQPTRVEIAVPADAQAARRRQEERAGDRKRAARLYFVVTLLAVLVLALAGLHGAGVTPTMLAKLFAHNSSSQQTTYSVPKGNPLFADPLVNDASGWNLQSAPGTYSVSVGNSGLTLESDQHKLLWELLPGERSYGDFTLVINAALTKGDQNNGYGVYIRGTANARSDLATYYRFELYGDGSYAIFKGMVNADGVSSATKLVGYTLNAAIQKVGKVNHIMIVAKGASLSLIVNGQLIRQLTDASYRAGSIALFVSNLPQASAGAQAQFSHLAIYPA